MQQISTNPKTALRPVLAGLFVAFCAMSGGESAVASCGDYLHKRGANESSAAAPMESHSDNRCENQRQAPLPVAPPPVPERENDELSSSQLVLTKILAGSDWDHQTDSSRVLSGFQERIDRPPQR